MWEVIFSLLAGFVFVAFGLMNELDTEKKRQQEIAAKLQSLPDFTTTHSIIGTDYNGFAIDDKREKICLFSNNGKSVSHRIMSYKDIFSVELFEDGSSITKTVRSSQIGGAVVGGVLLGGVGAIIGGLSGKTETSGNVNRVDLRLTVNDMNTPLHDINFMSIESKKSGPVYMHAIQNARRWHGIVDVIIKRADTQEKNSESQILLSNQHFSVADEIKKYADLYQAGVLTSDEFQQQKLKLLGNDRPST